MSAASMIGTVVGNYEISRQLGAGGMGAVYLAKHRLIGRRAAIKVLLPELSQNQEMVNRFFNEARSTAEIKHAGLIEIFDFGWHNGCAYLAMELLEGESLASFIKRERAPAFDLVVAIGRQVATAVGAAHGLGIVHRDLKPDNVFLTPDEEIACGYRAKVLDFGIAKLTSSSVHNSQTRAGAMMGTPLYMSPEQCRDAGLLDHRSDIYSLGCVLYEMVAGRPPFVDGGLAEIISAHLFQNPKPPRTHRRDLPEWLDAVIMKTLAKTPEERHQTMAELATALGKVVRVPARASHGPGLEPTIEMQPIVMSAPTTLGGAASQVMPTAPVSPLPVSPKKRATGLIAGVAIAVVAVGATLGVVLTRRSDDDQPPMHQAEAPVVSPSPPAPVPQPTPMPVETAAPSPAAVITPPPVAEPSMITIKVSSLPIARVFEGKQELGDTPVTLTRPQGSPRAALTLEKSGYQDRVVTLIFDAPQELSFELEKRTASSARARPAGDTSKKAPVYKDVGAKGWDD